MKKSDFKNNTSASQMAFQLNSIGNAEKLFGIVSDFSYPWKFRVRIMLKKNDSNRNICHAQFHVLEKKNQFLIRWHSKGSETAQNGLISCRKLHNFTFLHIVMCDCITCHCWIRTNVKHIDLYCQPISMVLYFYN